MNSWGLMFGDSRDIYNPTVIDWASQLKLFVEEEQPEF
jgi:hypothetical protein